MSFDSRLRYLAIAAVSACAVVLCESKVHATCGDYVTIRNGKADSKMPMNDHGGTQLPCHGPNCKAERSPEPIPAVPPAPLTFFNSEIDHKLSAIRFEQTVRSKRRVLSTSERPINRPSIPFDPPRNQFEY